MTGLVELLESVTAWGQPARLALALVVKSSLILTLALAAHAVLSRASAATRHLILLTGLGAAIVLPVAQLAAPPLSLELLPAAEGASETGAVPWTDVGSASSPEAGSEAAALGPSVQPSAPEGGTSPAGPQTRTASASLSPVALGGLIAGAVSLLLVAYLALGILRVRLLRRRSVELTDDSTWKPLLRRLRERLGISGRVSLWESPRVRVPLTLGVLRPEVVLPTEASDWTEEERRAVLLHELAHVRRRDWLAQIVARLVCSLYWFNPLVWIATGRMLVEAERACDDVVVTGGEGGPGYARQLLEMATRRRRELPTFGAVAMARRATLSRRIQAILDPSQRRSSPGRIQVVSVIGMALLLLLSVGPARIVRAEAAPSPSDLPGDPDREWELESNVDTETQSELDRIADLEELETVEGDLESGTDWQRDSESDTEIEADADGDLDRSYVGAPPLLAAVARGDRGAVRRLLAEGSNPNQGATELGTPLIVAAAMGDAQMVRVLLDGGAAPDLAQMVRETRPQLPRSPLGAAARSGNPEVVDLLLGAGASPDFVPAGDASPLMIAARHGHGEIVERLLAEGADPSRVVSGDGSPLIAAVRGGDRWIVERLLAAGADADRWVDGDESPLFQAVSSGRADLVRLLLEAGADPDARWDGDGTPLIVASRHGHGEIVELLLAAGARGDVGVEGDGNALISAARSGRTGLLRELLDSGADPNAAVRGDGSPLIAAAAMGHLSAVRLLVERGADVDLVVPGDETALIQAAAHGHRDVVEYLLDAGAAPNLAVRVEAGRDRTEIRSPLGEALENGHRDVVRLLRSRGAVEKGSERSSGADPSETLDEGRSEAWLVADGAARQLFVPES